MSDTEMIPNIVAVLRDLNGSGYPKLVADVGYAYSPFNSRDLGLSTRGCDRQYTELHYCDSPVIVVENLLLSFYKPS